MAGEGHIMLTIPKFDGDYEHWSMLMENLLRSKELWNLIETGYVEPARGEILTGAQRQTLADLKLKDLKGSKRVQRAQLQRLRREFEILEMKNEETIAYYFSRVLLVATDMRNLGEDMQDNQIVEKILCTLSEKFTYIVCSIEESSDIDSLLVDALQSSLLSHEQKIMRHHPKTTTKEEHVLQITSSREGSFGGVRGRGRGAFRGRGRGRGRFGFDKTQIECYRCHKFRHFQFECPSAENQVNYVEFNEEEELLLMAHVEIQGAKMEDLWFLDSGCSNHMSGIKKWFSDMDETFKHSVKLGNNARMMVHGKGSIKLKINGLVQNLSSK
ncbi:uncharacterized protein LOC127080243 [Lathyrus oleraceus]|uniref:uncharacterized protein LOC127080243 n=1 Tax=Pisum sativum TaxID=3888 RepID=UPI0021D31264|nr:uncharacterized protein LOC127080243 [Pisum sativum]